LRERWCHDIAKIANGYVRGNDLKKDTWDFINRSKYRMCISSVQQSNGNSIEFFLSTWTRSGSKASQSKFLYYLYNYYMVYELLSYTHHVI